MKYKTKTLISLIAILCFVSFNCFPQEKLTLQQCIDFAFENSYAVKQKMLEKETRYIQIEATKWSTAPSLGASVGQSFDFGRSALQNAVIVNTTQSTTSFGLSLGMDLFKGLRTYNQMKVDKLNLQSTLYDIESVKESIEITITAYFLQILLNKEQSEILKVQVTLDEEQVKRIEKLVENGKSSDAELYAAKATLANNQLSLVEAENAIRLARLDLAQLLNYQEVANFDIKTEQNLEDIDIILNKNIDVQTVTENALTNRAAIKSALNKIEIAKREIKTIQSGWYPTLGLSASFGTGYYYRFKELAEFPNEPFGLQFKNNARESIGLSLYIPIFDKLSTHYNIKQQKVTVKLQELQVEETKRNLIKEIEQAYANAVASKEKYAASQTAELSSKIAFQYEEIKFNAGSSTTYEYNESRNKYLRAQSQLLQAKFDFLFRIKILEFYGRN